MIYTLTLNPALDRELTVPAIAFDEVLRATEARVDCGGKGFNVSRMLAALGAESVAMGFAGGRAGEALRDGLEALGIAADFVPIAGETRTNVSIVTHDHDRHVKVNEPGPAISPEQQAALVARVRARARPGDWWVLAGSLPPGVAPTLYADLIRDIQAAGGRAVLDTSDEALRHGCGAGPFLVKPNAGEASQLTGLPIDSPEQAIAAARALAGIKQIAISMGKAGALLVSNGEGWLAAAPTIRERNPIGAGDALVGGLVWGLAHGLPPPDSLRWGVACGTVAASRPGTAVGSRDEVARLVERIEARMIA